MPDATPVFVVHSSSRGRYPLALPVGAGAWRTMAVRGMPTCATKSDGDRGVSRALAA